LRLELAEGQTEQHTSFNVTNKYDVAVTLRFVVERSTAANANQSRSADPTAFTTVDTPELTLAPGQSLNQTVRLRNTATLAPGSQLADLVVMHQSAGGRNISVAPAVRMPLTLIKLDGAVTSLGLTEWRTPRVAASLPDSSSLVLRNTGNMTAIPRGYISVEDRGGRVLAHGTINTASAAVTPGQQLDLKTSLTSTGSIWLPGVYKTKLAYGLGGDSGARTVTASFFYVAWWHLAILAGLIVGIFYLTKFLRQHWHKKVRARPPTRPKRPALIGRDIS
jgi:hypothetical protein